MKKIFFTLLVLCAFVPDISFSQRVFHEYNGRLSFSMDPVFAPFYHGVASGDPLQDRVIIWTRVTSLAPVDSILVEWKMATDTNFQNIVNQGNLYTKEEKDFTVKVDVTGLQPNTWYYYMFTGLGVNSIIGRTKTAPVGAISNVRFAVVGGSNYNNGYYNAYNHIAYRNDIDAVVHTGDYIYEYGTNSYGNHPDRGLAPAWDCVTLSDYRMRYSHYRLDPDLRLLHQQYPWWVIWDDHETANDSYMTGAENHNPSTQGAWADRKAAGLQAYMEWIPCREINDPAHPTKKISRSVKYGDLAHVIFLDTRLEGRDDPNGLPVDDPNKTILGQHQYNWFTSELLKAQYTDTAQWKIIMQQVVFAPLNFVAYTNKDQWDGYQSDRQKVLNYINYYNIKNSVVVTGDIHTSWAFDVPNPNLGTYGANGQGVGTVEFVSPSVTSPSVSVGGGIGAAAIMAANPHLKWVDLVNRGYVILDISPAKTQADWFFVNDINSYGGYSCSFGQAWYVEHLQNYLKNSSSPTAYTGTFQPFAPFLPSLVVDVQEPDVSVKEGFVLLAAYPNPFSSDITLQLYAYENTDLHVTLKSIDGREVYNEKFNVYSKDIYYHHFSLNDLKSGYYILNITSSDGTTLTKKLVKI